VRDLRLCAATRTSPRTGVGGRRRLHRPHPGVARRSRPPRRSRRFGDMVKLARGWLPPRHGDASPPIPRLRCKSRGPRRRHGRNREWLAGIQRTAGRDRDGQVTAQLALRRSRRTVAHQPTPSVARVHTLSLRSVRMTSDRSVLCRKLRGRAIRSRRTAKPSRATTRADGTSVQRLVAVHAGEVRIGGMPAVTMDHLQPAPVVHGSTQGPCQAVGGALTVHSRVGAGHTPRLHATELPLDSSRGS
jgi:hypothetical protein